MNIKDLEQRLNSLDAEITTILKDSGFLDYEELCIDFDKNADELMRINEYQHILTHLINVHQNLGYLKLPITHEGILHMNPNGRYELDGRELTCGCSIEVLLYNEANEQDEWCAGNLEYNDGYYIVGQKKMNLEGKQARIRW